MESFELCVGDKLWYINKFSGELESVYIMLVDEVSLNVTYNGKTYSVPLSYIGTRLFCEIGDAWLAWNAEHSSCSVRDDEITATPPPKHTCFC